MKEKYGRPLVSKARIAEWPSITALQRGAMQALSAQTPSSHKRKWGLGRDRTVRERAHKHIPPGRGRVPCEIL